MEKYEVILYDMDSASEVKGTVYADEGDTSDDIILEISVGKNTITEKADSYLAAYQKLRDELLKNGFGLKCNGSLVNANQSGMMSYTSKIYLVELGKQALTKDIVNIWDHCDMTSFPDTKEQNSYIEKWYDSFKRI